MRKNLLFFLFLFSGLSLANQNSDAGCVPDTLALAKSGAVAHHHTDHAFYIAGMEKSSLQKGAFALLAREGDVYDIGSGSGITARDLSILMYRSRVTGIDLDPSMTKYAKEHYQRSNLNFVTGDALKTGLPNQSADAIFTSSTGHHLTSYNEPRFDVANVLQSFDEAKRLLRPNGIYVVRDFVVPQGPEWVHLSLPANDGATTGTPKELSTASLFEKFAGEFRSSQHPNSPVPYAPVSSSKPNWKTYRVPLRDAAEFVLRKDYRESYDAEIKEEYTYLPKRGFDEEMAKRGFRILHSGPIYNPWIVSNRYEGKFELSTEEGKEVPHPPTNFVIVGQKVPEHEGIQIRQVSASKVGKSEFIQLKTMQDKETGKLVDVVGRPGETMDLIPFWEQPDGTVFVIGKEGFPRPLTQSLGETPNLSGITTSGYRVEPITFLNQGSVPNFQAIEKNLLQKTGINSSRIRSGTSEKAVQFYSSPGNIDERITSRSVEVDPTGIKFSPQENYSGFSTSGDARPFEAQKVLHAAQAGSVLDARFELGVYHLLLDKQKSVGPWIGDEIKLRDQELASGPKVQRAATVLLPKKRERAFRNANPGETAGFLETWRGDYEEVNQAGKVVAKASREYVVPKKYSHNVVSTIPVAKVNGKILVKLEKRNLPAVQLHEGFSDVVTNPAFRLPREIATPKEAHRFVVDALKKEEGVAELKSWELGGSYQSSIGVTPETVYPRAVEVEYPADGNGLWVELRDLVRNRHLLKDGHTSVAILRLAHALGELP